MKRPKSHIVGDSFRWYIEKVVNPLGWIIREKSKDYGIDIEIEIVEDEEVSGKILWFQVKSSNRLNIEENHVKCRLGLDLIKYSMRCDIPIILLVYDTSHEIGYWIWIQKYVHKNDKILFLNQKTTMVKIPIKNVFHKKLLEMEEIAKNGSSYLIQYRLGKFSEIVKKEKVENERRWLLLLERDTIDFINDIYQFFGTQWFTFTKLHEVSGPDHIFSVVELKDDFIPCLEKGFIKYKPAKFFHRKGILKEYLTKEMVDLYSKKFKLNKDLLDLLIKEKLI